MANLITLAEYKSLTGVAVTNTVNDTQITALLAAASRAVRSFTDRRFDVSIGSSTRTFLLTDDPFLELDDFTAIWAVTYTVGTSSPYPLDAQQYTALPYRETADDDPHYYLQFTQGFARSGSPEMGFRNNLDTMDFRAAPVVVSVTGTWGWPAVPDDVKLATAWIIQDTISKAGNDDLRSESIESYSRSWGATKAGQSLAIPSRARDILLNYQRPF